MIKTVTSRDINPGAVALPKRRTYDSRTMGQFKEVHVYIKFGPVTGAYDTLTPTRHNLGSVPRTWTIVETGIHSPTAGARPGTIYTDTPAPFSRDTVAFRCTVPYTWAVIALR